jgi:hypothetical protein
MAYGISHGFAIEIVRYPAAHRRPTAPSSAAATERSEGAVGWSEMLGGLYSGSERSCDRRVSVFCPPPRRGRPGRDTARPGRAFPPHRAGVM